MSEPVKYNNHPLLFGQIATLNGLRGLCIFWVMFVHLPMTAIPGVMTGPYLYWRFGVDFFLAISGFLVVRSLIQCYARSVAKSRSVASAARDFVARRISRIWPSYFFFFAVLFGVAFATRNNLYHQLVSVTEAIPSFFLFYANFVIPGQGEHLPRILEPLWSVSFQEQFYLILAVLMLFGIWISSVLGRSGPKDLEAFLGRALFFLGGVSVFLRFYHVLVVWAGETAPHNLHLEFWLHLNFDALAWGCLAWLYYDRLSWLWAAPARRLVSSLAILGTAVFAIVARSYWHTDLGQAVLATVKAPALALVVRMVCEFRDSSSFVCRGLRLKALGELGNCSYEVYLFHVLMFGILQKLRLDNSPLFLAVAYPVCIGVGYLVYRWVGRPGQEALKSLLSGDNNKSRPVAGASRLAVAPGGTSS